MSKKLITLKVTEADHDLIMKASEKVKTPVSKVMREHLLNWATRVLGKQGQHLHGACARCERGNATCFVMDVGLVCEYCVRGVTGKTPKLPADLAEAVGRARTED